MKSSLSLSLRVSAVRGLALATVLLASAPAFGQYTLPPPYQRDGEIYFDSQVMDYEDFGGTGGANMCIQLNSFVEFRGMNRRTVGNGLIGQTVDADGALLNAAELIGDGLLARDAVVRVTTFGKEALKSGVRSSKVRVNGCVAQPDLLFHYGRATSRRIYHQELRVDAACLRYGVRPNEEAAQPDAKENRIRIETAEMLPDELATECGDHGSSWVSAYLKGDALWWDEQNPRFRETRLMPVADGGGEENARLSEHHSVAIVEFEALAPIALVHGYTSSVEFWTKHDERGRKPETASDRFTAPFDEQHVGYGLMSTKNASGEPSRNRWDKKPNIAPGTTGRVSAALLPELRALATRFGADYVNIVSHSMGAIWSRAAIELLKASTPDENAPGVLNFVALSPMHHGSVLADLREVYSWKNIPKFYLFGETGQGGFSFWKRMATRLRGRADASLTYATTWKVAEFNREPELPEEFLVKGMKTRLGKWTLANSFNENENCNADHLDQVECGDHAKDPDECIRQRQTLWFGLDLSRAVNQARSNTLQRLQRVEIGSTPSGRLVAEFIAQPFPAEPSTAGCPQGRYPLNDLTLRTQDMFYRNFSMLPGTAGRSYHFANHSMLGHSSVAEDVRLFPLRADEQSGLKEKQ